MSSSDQDVGWEGQGTPVCRTPSHVSRPVVSARQVFPNRLGRTMSLAGRVFGCSLLSFINRASHFHPEIGKTNKSAIRYIRCSTNCTVPIGWEPSFNAARDERVVKSIGRREWRVKTTSLSLCELGSSRVQLSSFSTAPSLFVFVPLLRRMDERVRR